MNRTRVLIAESGSGYGGSARYLSALLPFLDATQFSIEVVAYGKGPFIQQIKNQGWKVNFYKAWRFPWISNRLAMMAQLMVIVPILTVWLYFKRFRVVHLNNEILSHLPLLLAARLLGCQILCHFHGWRNLTAIEKIASRYVDKSIAVTQSGADFYSWQLDGKNVEGIPNGLVIEDKVDEPAELREQMRGQLGLNPNDFLAILIGRIIPLKGHSVFFRALAEVREKNSNVRGWVVGNDPSDNGQYLAKLKSELKTLNLENHVTFLPWQDQMGPVYEASDVVVQPSVEPESFGYVALEAMAAGKPVVASRLGGLIDVIQDGQTGFLVEAGNSKELASAIHRIAADSLLAAQLGRHGRDRARTAFTMTHNAECITGAYHQLLNQDRILIAESGSGYGGTANYLAHLLASVKRSEFAVQVVAYGKGPFIKEIERQWPLYHSASWRYPWGERDEVFGKILTGTKRSRILKYARSVLISFFQIAFMVPVIYIGLRRKKISLVHLNNGIRSHIPLVIAARLAGCRLLCHFHGWRPFTRTEKWLAPWVDQFIAISEAGGVFLRTQISSENITAIPNGLSAVWCDFSKERIQSERAIFKIEKEAIVVSIIGRLVEWKGQEVYLRALAQVVKTHPHVVGIILGHDPTPDQQFLKKLRALSEQLGVSACVRFLPWQEDVHAVYGISDLIVHASTDPEPFGLVILEAMLAGKPVIAAKGGGVSDLILERESGLLVEPNHSDELARAIVQLIGDPKYARELGDKARLRAQTFFSIERNATRVQELYHHLLVSPQSKTWLAGLRWRSHLKRLMFNTGAVRLVRESLGYKVPILMYHKISRELDPFVPSISEKAFKDQMNYIKQCYQIISMDELVKVLRSGERPLRKSMVVTFDDGNAPTLNLALPILQGLRVPATIFLSASPTEDNTFLWTDLLRLWFKFTKLNHYAIQLNGQAREWKLSGVQERLCAARDISKKLKRVANEDRKRFMDQIGKDLAVREAQLPKDWMLSGHQIKSIRESHLRFGAHTITHPILSRMPLQEARYEIFESKRWLENILNDKVRHFAYPNGEPGDFTEEHELLAAQAGFDSACSAIVGLNDSGTNRYALRRIYGAEESLANFSTRLVGIGS